MGDSTAMTIEFLRARLLSERSISKTARQRADQLAKRVLELEEQLKVMIVQRKKAENMTAELLDILEYQGIEGFIEITGSSSDRDDVDCGGIDSKGDETSTTSGMDKGEVDNGLLELESSASQGKALSWKGRSSRPYSPKQKVEQIRQRQRQGSLNSNFGSSGRHRSGKSCRKIKQREARSTSEDEQDKSREEGSIHSNHSDEQLEFPRDASRNEIDEVSHETSPACSLGDLTKETDNGIYANKKDGVGEMERVLEKQALLIGQYQEEENAQREWEEKYNENKSPKLDFCEPEDHPGAAEVSTKPEETRDLAGENPYYVEEAKPRSEDYSTARRHLEISAPIVQTPHSVDPEMKTEISLSENSIGLLPKDLLYTDSSKTDGNNLQDCTGLMGELPALEHRDMTSNSTNRNNSSHNNSRLYANGSGLVNSSSSESSFTLNSGSKDPNWRSMGIQNLPLISPPQPADSKLGSVLQALHHAKTSIGRELNAHQLPHESMLTRVKPSYSHLRARSYSNDFEIPIGTSGLFRLPTDSFPQAGLSMPKIQSSRLLSLTSTCPDARYAIVPNEYKYPSSTIPETGPRVPIGRQSYDPYSHLITMNNSSWDGLSRSGYSSYSGNGAQFDTRRL